MACEGSSAKAICGEEPFAQAGLEAEASIGRCSCASGQAVKKVTGLAEVLYTELSGDAGLAIYRRLDVACQSAGMIAGWPETPSVSVGQRV